MFRFSLFRTIRTVGRALPSRTSRRGCRPILETLEDRSVPAGQIITVGTQVGQVDLGTAISQSNTDAANHQTTPTDPDIIQFAVGYTPVPLQGLVQNTGNLKIDGNLDIVYDSVANVLAKLNNTGTLHVTGNVTLDDESILSNGLTNTDSAKLTVDGGLSLGNTGSIDNWGTSSISVAGEVSFADHGTIYNGGISLDIANASAAVSLSAGSLSMGFDALVYNLGASAISVSTNFTLGDGSSQYYGGLTGSATTSLAVSGNFAIGEDGFTFNYGHSTIDVTGDFALGSDGILENGILPADAATFTVHGSFSIGNPGDGPDLSGAVVNTANSTIAVTHDFTVYGDEGSIVENGALDTDAALMTVGGQFSMGANSQFLEFGNQSFQTNGFTLGADSSFGDYGTMIVSGQFDAGARTVVGTPNDIIAGHFLADAGSTVTTNSAVWEVQSGGVLDIASGTATLAAAVFSVPAGGTLLVDLGGTVTVDAGASVTIGGHLTVDGIVDPPTITVQGSGVVTIDAGGQLTVDSLTVADSAAVNVAAGTLDAGGNAVAGGQLTVGSLTVSDSANLDVAGPTTDAGGNTIAGGQVTASSLTATDSAVIDVFGGLTAETVSLQNPDQLIQETGSNVDVGTPPAMLTQTITFNTPSNVMYSTGSTSVSLSASASSGLAVIFSIAPGSSTYASVTGSTVTILPGTPAGTVIKVEADQPGNTTYDPADATCKSFTITQAIQSITFHSLPPMTTSDPSFTLTATASSGLPVTYASSGNVTLTQNGNVWTVQPTGTGSVTITAYQTGNGNYSAAAPVMQTFSISAAGTTVTVPSGQQYAFTDPNGNQVSIKATGGAATKLSFQTVSGNRMQLTGMAVTGATSATNLTVSSSGATTINNLTIAGSGMHDISLAGVTVNGLSSSVPMHNLVVGSLQGTIKLTGGGYDAAIGTIGTASGSAAVKLSGGFHDVVFGIVVSGSSFTLTGTAQDLAFGDVAAGATVSFGTSSQSAVVHDFVGGVISGSLFVYGSFHNAAVLSISGHVFLKSIGGTFLTASRASGPWVGADLALAGGGDILLGTISDKPKVIAL
jgi:hypothetical protein